MTKKVRRKPSPRKTSGGNRARAKVVALRPVKSERVPHLDALRRAKGHLEAAIAACESGNEEIAANEVLDARFCLAPGTRLSGLHYFSTAGTVPPGAQELHNNVVPPPRDRPYQLRLLDLFGAEWTAPFSEKHGGRLAEGVRAACMLMELGVTALVRADERAFAEAKLLDSHCRKRKLGSDDSVYAQVYELVELHATRVPNVPANIAVLRARLAEHLGEKVPPDGKLAAFLLRCLPDDDQQPEKPRQSWVGLVTELVLYSGRFSVADRRGRRREDLRRSVYNAANKLLKQRNERPPRAGVALAERSIT